MEVKLNGYSATIDIYHEQKGYVCGDFLIEKDFDTDLLEVRDDK